MWEAVNKYQELMETEHLCYFDDLAHYILREVTDPKFVPPYTHIVIDEVQDLDKAQILAISKLVKSQTNSISIFADAAQEIYKKGFSWKEVGIDVTSNRTKEIRVN